MTPAPLTPVDQVEYQRRTHGLHGLRATRLLDTPPRFSIADAVRMGVQMESKTGQAAPLAWLIALPVRVAVAQIDAEHADIRVMRRLQRMSAAALALEQAGLAPGSLA